MLGRLVALALVLVLSAPAFAGDPQFWGNYPDEIRSWFPTVMQPSFEDTHDAGHSCCGIADAFEARVTGNDQFGNITVVIDDGKGVIPDGTIVQAPRAKIQTKYGNPTGHLIVFISVGDHKTVYCLVPLTEG